MRQLTHLAPLLLLLGTACGGDKTEDTAEPASCEDYQTVSLSTLSVSEWPAGLDDALEAYDTLRGSWRGTSCVAGDDQRVDLSISGPAHEELRIVEFAPDASAACGCLNDPDFGPDNHLGPIALIPEVTLQFEGTADPAVDDQTLTGVGALFPSASGLKVRVCGMRQSDPVEGSDYDDAHLTFRIDDSDQPSATVKLVEVEGNLEPHYCEIIDLTK